MPRINPDEYLDYEDEGSLDIQDDDPVSTRGRPAPPVKPTRQDLDWEERRRELQRNKLRRSAD